MDAVATLDAKFLSGILVECDFQNAAVKRPTLNPAIVSHTPLVDEAVGVHSQVSIVVCDDQRPLKFEALPRTVLILRENEVFGVEFLISTKRYSACIELGHSASGHSVAQSGRRPGSETTV